MNTLYRVGSGRSLGRIRQILGYDGPVASTVLGVFAVFVASVSFLASMLPALLFQALVGWQGTHAAIWLGAISLTTVFPGIHGLLAAATSMLDDGFESARAARRFWQAFGTAFRGLWWMSAVLPAATVILGYDYALMGGNDVVLLLVVSGAALAIALVVGVAATAQSIHTCAPVVLMTRTVSAMLRRPHVVLAWLLIVGLTVSAMVLPVIGAVAVLLLPAGAALAIVVCNRSLGYSALVDGAAR